jgi:hypothetical protein
MEFVVIRSEMVLGIQDVRSAALQITIGWRRLVAPLVATLVAFLAIGLVGSGLFPDGRLASPLPTARAAGFLGLLAAAVTCLVWAWYAGWRAVIGNTHKPHSTWPLMFLWTCFLVSLITLLYLIILVFCLFVFYQLAVFAFAPIDEGAQRVLAQLAAASDQWIVGPLADLAGDLISQAIGAAALASLFLALPACMAGSDKPVQDSFLLTDTIWLRTFSAWFTILAVFALAGFGLNLLAAAQTLLPEPVAMAVSWIVGIANILMIPMLVSALAAVSTVIWRERATLMAGDDPFAAPVPSS